MLNGPTHTCVCIFIYLFDATALGKEEAELVFVYSHT